MDLLYFSNFSNTRAFLVAVPLAVACVQAVQADEIEIMHFWSSQSERNALDVFARAYEADNGGIWIEDVQADYAMMRDEGFTRLTNGTAPTAIFWQASPEMQRILDAGVITPIDDLVSRELIETIHPDLRGAVNFNGTTAALPVNVHGSNWAYYSTDIMSEFGFSAPTNWDMFFSQMEVIQAAGYPTIAMGGGTWEQIYVFEAMLLANGGQDLLKVRHTGIVPDDLMDELLLSINDFIRFQGVLQTSGLIAESWNVASLAVAQGDATVQFMGDWAKGEMVGAGYAPDENFLCQMAPGSAQNYILVLDSFVMPFKNDPTDIAAQIDFIEIVLDPDNQAEFSRLKGSLPVVVGVDLDALDVCGRLGLSIIETHGFVDNQNMASSTPAVSEALYYIIDQIITGELNNGEDARSELIRQFDVARRL